MEVSQDMGAPESGGSRRSCLPSDPSGSRSDALEVRGSDSVCPDHRYGRKVRVDLLSGQNTAPDRLLNARYICLSPSRSSGWKIPRRNVPRGAKGGRMRLDRP